MINDYIYQKTKEYFQWFAEGLLFELHNFESKVFIPHYTFQLFITSALMSYGGDIIEYQSSECNYRYLMSGLFVYQYSKKLLQTSYLEG